MLERLSFDAWGKRRHPNGSDDPAGAITSQTSRGFTGHEELDSVGLVHMNGRVYDPLLARFGTADPITENPFSTQGWNRYSYVGNSPLNFTDPSGYCFMGCFWKSAFRAIGNFVRQNWGAIVQFAVSAACSASVVCAPFLPIVAGLTSAIITGVSSGKLGMALKAGFITAVTAGISQYIGQQLGELGGGFAGGSEGSPVAASSGDPSTWGPRMGLGGPSADATTSVSYAQGYRIEYWAPNGDLPAAYLFTPSAPAAVAPAATATTSIGQSLAQGAFSAIPGAVYSQLALQQFRTGNYGYATAYIAASFADSAMAIATFGMSARLTAGARGLVTPERIIVSPGGVAVDATIADRWARGTFPNVVDSLEYHFAKHGAGRTLQQYTDDAARFFETHRAEAQWGRWNPRWEESFRLKNGGRGGYFTADGKILTYWD